MKNKELRELNSEELIAKFNELKEELFNLKFQASLGQIENSAKIRTLKRSIAVIKTIQREREISQGQ